MSSTCPVFTYSLIDISTNKLPDNTTINITSTNITLQTSPTTLSPHVYKLKLTGSLGIFRSKTIYFNVTTFNCTYTNISSATSITAQSYTLGSGLKTF